MLTLTNVFRKDISTYRRDFNFIPNWIAQTGKYLSIRYRHPLQECIDFATLEAEKLPALRKVRMVKRNDKTGDREKAVTTVREYIQYVVREQKILSPTLSVYDNKRQRRSVLSVAIHEMFQQRKEYKKAMFSAIANNAPTDTINFLDAAQSGEKDTANSASGAQAAQGTILQQRTAHPALTANCRLDTTLTNAFLEKFLAGNRHYSSMDNIFQNIVSIATLTDMTLVYNAVASYQLHIPTPKECLSVITRCADYYFCMAPEETQELLSFLTNMSDLERAAFAYVGDLATLAKYNHALVHHLLTGLMKKDPTNLIDHEEGLAYLNNVDGFYHVFYNSLIFNRLEGKDDDTRQAYMRTHASRFGAVIHEHYQHLHRYSPLFDAFFCTKNLPADVWNFPNSTREVAIASDTDSGIFTTQDWAKWLEGWYVINEATDAMRDVLTFLATKITQHNLAIISANLGIAPEDYDYSEMKNEYGFRIVGITSQGKHYFASQDVREGNVFARPKIEIKGKELVASDKSPEINALKVWIIEYIFEQMRTHSEIDINPILDRVAALEAAIDRQLADPDKSTLQPLDINIASAYKDGIGAYRYHQMWEEVFAPLGYPTTQPPYRAYKVSTGIDSESKMKKFLANMTDGIVRHSIELYMSKYNKKQIGTWYVPEVAMDDGGVPPALIGGIDRRKMISKVMNPIYLLLETLGFFYRLDGSPRLVMDEWEVSSIDEPIAIAGVMTELVENEEGWDEDEEDEDD